MLHQSETTLSKYAVQTSAAASLSPQSVALQSTDAVNGSKFDFTFEALRPGIFRTTFFSPSHPLPPFPSAHKPSVSKHEGAPGVVDAAANTYTITAGGVKAVVNWTHAPVVSLFGESQERPIYKDMSYRSYVVDGPGIAHYSAYAKDEFYVGLGEKAAPMNLGGRSFQITASDTFGYDAYRTDPLYKHIPLLVHVSPPSEANNSKGAVVAMFSTAHSRGVWNVGSEIDGMWGHFKVYRQAYGGLEQYLLVGSTLAEVVRLYADLVGYPLLPPRYYMGYVGGGMKYSMEDGPPKAHDVIVGFIDKCKEHGIPVSAFQMSSGYTVATTKPKTRNVFTWNRTRFPDPRAFTRQCHARGVRILANIKPYLLDNHPAYQQLKTNNAFFQDPSSPDQDKTGRARLWSAGGGESGEGSHIDFTSEFGYQWWRQGCLGLAKVGIDAMWNDNNEYNIFSDNWACALDGKAVREHAAEIADTTDNKTVGFWGRALNTELMAKSSASACAEAFPNDRPVVLTRSATAGTMRYSCSSWSGDNVTSWEGMRGANAISLNAGVSLLHCYGHDIGGFEGPQPDAELLVRWVQLGVHQPRFAINCYKTSPEDNLVGDVIEPWMHPVATPYVREAIRRRYELIPYVYSAAIASHLSALPPMRWIGWGYESDPGVWARRLLAGDTQYWFGSDLVVGGVYEPGVDVAEVYLPAGEDTAAGFLNVNAPYEWLAAGQWHSVSSPWYASIPVLARCGSALPVGARKHTTSRNTDDYENSEFPNTPLDSYRGVELYPVQASKAGNVATETFTNTWLEDDGLSAEGRSQIYEIKVVYMASDTEVTVWASISVKKASTVEGAPAWEPLWLRNGLDVMLPVGDERTVVGNRVDKKERDFRNRNVYNIAVWELPTIDIV